MTAQEAAKLLLSGLEDPWHGDEHIPGFRDIDWQKVYNAMTEDHNESMEIGGTHDWPALLVVALREIADEDLSKAYDQGAEDVIQEMVDDWKWDNN